MTSSLSPKFGPLILPAFFLGSTCTGFLFFFLHRPSLRGMCGLERGHLVPSKIIQYNRIHPTHLIFPASTINLCAPLRHVGFPRCP